MYSIKRLILLVVVVSWLVGQPALAASNEPTDGTARQASQAASILRVDDDSGAVSPNGSSWANAYPTLQDALAVATNGNEIWVAAGIYYPDEGSGQTNNARHSTFSLASGVAIYGGFAGTETARSQRDWETNVTVLSGDIDGNDTDDDNDGIISSTSDIVGSNAYHVVRGNGTDNTAILDGFTINAGQANGSIHDDNGGGMYNYSGHPTLTNMTFTSNLASFAGGGMFNDLSHPTLTNVAFTSNSAEDGGGMYNSADSPTLTNVTFTRNLAQYGGGMYSYLSNLTLTNVIFSRNSTGAHGGGMYHDQGNPVLTNVTFSGNSALSLGGAIFDDHSNMTLTNLIIWNNQANGSSTATWASIYNYSGTSTISYSLIANSGGSANWSSNLSTDGGNNIDVDPQFVMDGESDSDYRLQIDSPAIDAGNNSAIGGGITTDLAGNSRFADVTSQADTGNGSSPVIDMGAYEVGSSDMQSNLSEGESYDLNNSSLQIDTLGNLDTIAVYHVEQSYPDAPEGIQTGHYWQVNVVDNTGSEASGFSLSVTLPHTLATPSDARICRYTGSAWDCGDNSNTSADATTVTRSGMSAFSPIAVGNAALPLAVNLASFTAEASVEAIELEWVTVSELNNLGFNLYRATSPDGEQRQLNSDLIPAQAPGSGQGSAYEFVDQEIEVSQSYFYWLEDIDVNGNRTMHGPISATPSNPTALSLQAFGSHQSGSQIWGLLVGILSVMGAGAAIVLRRFMTGERRQTLRAALRDSYDILMCRPVA